MKKKFLFVNIFILVFTIIGCEMIIDSDPVDQNNPNPIAENNIDPFELMNSVDSFYYYGYVSYTGEQEKHYYHTYSENMHSDNWIMYFYSIDGTQKNYKTKDFIYEYDYSSSKWYRSIATFVDTEGVDLWDKDNFVYDDTTMTYTLKGQISAGSYLSYTVRILDENMFRVNFSVNLSDTLFDFSYNYSRFGEDFGLTLPTSFLIR